MAKDLCHLALLVWFTLSISISYSEQLQSSQPQTLLRIQALLNYPSLLSSWNNETDFCSTEPSATLTVVCYDDSITQLHMIGEKGTPPLPDNFSIDSFFTTLVKLPSLKVLTLVSLGLWGPLPDKISRLSALEILNLSLNFLHGSLPQEIVLLTHLQSLIIDGNMFTGTLPDGLGSLSALAVLSVKNNSLNGTLPDSLGSVQNLRILAMSDNNFSGDVPDLSSMENLQVLDLGQNSLGPQFPLVTSKIMTIVLRRNKFTSSIPEKVQSYYQLERLDISANKLVGRFPPSLLSLPSIDYLNISENKLTGMLVENLPCNTELEVVDLSANQLTGRLPSCLLSDSKNKVVQYAGNCLATGDKSQHAISFCQNEALAVGLLPHHHKHKRPTNIVLALSITLSIIGGIVLLGLTFFVLRKFLARKAAEKPATRLIAENASTSYSSKLLSDAMYITQAMKLGAVALPAYRTFSLEELEEATNNFDTSSFIGEGSNGQMYKGQLKDGSHVAIRCLKLKRRQSTQNFMHYIDLVSKLRHHHLASALGHCFECYLDDSSVSRIFLVFEYVPNGTLRSWISEKRARRKLNWAQRIAAAIGVAKGIQFLHKGIVPGVFSNNLRITDILLDHNLVAKISSYNLPLVAEHTGKDSIHNTSSGSKELMSARVIHQEKSDIYDFGVILLEIITGKPIHSFHGRGSKNSESSFDATQVQVRITADDASRKSVLDQAVKNVCSSESLKTMIEICWRCLLKDPADRPSIEDVLWNLQFAAQVQDAWKGDSQSSECSPVSPVRPTSLKLTIYSE